MATHPHGQRFLRHARFSTGRRGEERDGWLVSRSIDGSGVEPPSIVVVRSADVVEIQDSNLASGLDSRRATIYTITPKVNRESTESEARRSRNRRAPCERSLDLPTS